MKKNEWWVTLGLVLTTIAMVGSCAGAGAGAGGGGAPTSDSGLDLAFTMSSSSVSGLSTQAYSTASDVSVSSVCFRGSDLSFYAIDEATLLAGDIDNPRYKTAAEQAKSTEVRMALPDVPNTFEFSASGANQLPIDQVGDFRNLEYNLININIGHGNFYYMTDESGHYYALQPGDGNTYNIMGVDRVKVSNILLVDEALWQELHGTAETVVLENSDMFMLNNSNSEGYVVEGNGAFWNSTNPLIEMLQEYAWELEPDDDNGFDVDGAIIYPMDGPVDLTAYTELENGYLSLDPDSVNIDITISMQWDMPTTVGYEVLFDPSNLDPGDAVAYSDGTGTDVTVNDVFARLFYGDLTVFYEDLNTAEYAGDEWAQELYNLLPAPEGVAQKSLYNRYITRTTSDVDTYDFSVGVQVTQN